uniref:Uncharacterized protein n=1 Tax=Chromera velia CCMP2878 TaxID=1169474 RepID=A0A0G4F6V6_9ALVE|eukprot:Cvel_15511.t1-p1 / transcript=Cvel_15511.t1 / gene=Cvel_15511 / organism=Chromera_velia_CCMP2878 / gene_product=hypothetical protein / transcript_product=hypothetical protein / location=Cvel_scaffold1152:4808-5008(+) / protein_length=67 / sequence_SO=supercontig / SO=protein_coding / is_pseudo=false
MDKVPGEPLDEVIWRGDTMLPFPSGDPVKDRTAAEPALLLLLEIIKGGAMILRVLDLCGVFLRDMSS